MNFLTILF